MECKKTFDGTVQKYHLQNYLKSDEIQIHIFIIDNKFKIEMTILFS